MSDMSQGADWWKANDSLWYPPERHPDFSPPAAPQPEAERPAPPPPVTENGPGPGWWKANDGQWYAPERHPDNQPRTAGRRPPPPPTMAQPQVAASTREPDKTNKLAIVALVAGVLGPFTGLGAFVAIITGHLGLVKIKQSHGAEGGRGLAIAGLVLGYAYVALIFLIIVILIATTDPSTT